MSHTEPASVTDTEILQGIGRELQAANKRLETMKNCLVFLVVVYIVTIALSIAILVQSD